MERPAPHRPERRSPHRRVPGGRRLHGAAVCGVRLGHHVPAADRLQGLRRYAPYDRAAEIRDRFAPRGGTAPPRLSRRDDPPRDLLGNPVEQRADDAAVEAAVGAAEREAVDETAAEYEALDEAAVETAAEAPRKPPRTTRSTPPSRRSPTRSRPRPIWSPRRSPPPALGRRRRCPSAPRSRRRARAWPTGCGGTAAASTRRTSTRWSLAVAQIADGGADRAVAFVEDVVALVAALELADVRLLPYIAAQLPHRFDDAPAWTVRERRAVRYALARPDRYGARLAEADVARDVVRTLLDRLARVVLSLEKDPAVPLRVLARDMLGDRRKLPPCTAARRRAAAFVVGTPVLPGAGAALGRAASGRLRRVNVHRPGLPRRSGRCAAATGGAGRRGRDG
ncbi:hypothetical protein ACU686_01480 [Yinghuangia aomiensis]